jgi:hypothetical protein
MKNRSHVLLVVAALSAGVLPAAGVPATAPLHVLPVQHDIWLSGTLHRNDGKRTGADSTTIRLDRPAASPCSDSVVTDILVGDATAKDPVFLLPYVNQRVAVKGRVICPASGIRFAPEPDFVFPIY